MPTSLIPTDPSAFVDWFKNSFLPRWAANADIRNATPGTGVQIGGTSDTPGFVGFEKIAGNSVLGNPTGASGDVQPITAGADGESLQRINGSLVFAPVSVATADSVTGTGSALTPVQLVNDTLAPGNSEYYGTNVSGTKGFFALPASAGSSITTLTQAGGISQTYNVPGNANSVYVICIGGGGGGGSGIRCSAATSASGGTGGGGGSISVNLLRAADLGPTVAVTFSSTTGGTGAAASAATGSGNNGVVGSDVSFGNFCAAKGGNRGSSGSQGGTAGGAAAQLLQANFATGTASPNQSTGAIGVAGNSPGCSFPSATSIASLFSACAGGNGGGVNTVGGTSFAGGAGGGTTQAGGFPTQIPGGAGGAVGANGSQGTNGSGTQGGSGGGGGGGTLSGASGGNGATGGNFGGGGGGGGCCNLTPVNSSAGGNGGLAACIVIAW